MSKRIPLTQGKFAIIDDDDFEKVSRFKWYAVCQKEIWYARTGVRFGSTHNKGITKRWQAHMYLHQFILHPKPGFISEHKNRDGLDCRKTNLREAHQCHNTYNRRGDRNSSSKYKGVSWCKRDNCWRSHIQHQAIGTFANETQAAIAYDKKARELFGEFAYLNFPERD